MKPYFLFLLLAAMTSAPALAQNSVLWSGGIGADERAEAPQEGTRLVFAVRSGAYLSRVQVRISNAQGEELLNTTIDGPWLILDLPDGTYSVNASIENRSDVNASFTVGGTKRQFIIAFPD